MTPLSLFLNSHFSNDGAVSKPRTTARGSVLLEMAQRHLRAAVLDVQSILSTLSKLAIIDDEFGGIIAQMDANNSQAVKLRSRNRSSDISLEKDSNGAKVVEIGPTTSSVHSPSTEIAGPAMSTNDAPSTESLDLPSTPTPAPVMLSMWIPFSDASDCPLTTTATEHEPMR
jgi:hypothetical protein